MSPTSAPSVPHWTARLRDVEGTSRFSAREADKLVRLYADAERRAAQLLEQAIAKGNVSSYLAGIERQLGAIRTELLSGVRTWSNTSLPSIYLQAAQRADAQLFVAGDFVRDADGTIYSLSGRPLSVADRTVVEMYQTFGAVHQGAMKTLAEGVYGNLEDSTYRIFREVDDVFRRVSLSNVTDSIAGLRSHDAVARSLRDQLMREVDGLPRFVVRPDGKIAVRDSFHAFIDKSGRRWKTDAYARMVARTSTMEAHLAGSTNRMVELGEDIVEVSAHSEPCPLCSPWEGALLSLTGASADDPDVDGTLEEATADGLFHPNCEHALSLFTRDFQEILKEQGITEPDVPDPDFADDVPFSQRVTQSKSPADVEKLCSDRWPDCKFDFAKLDLPGAQGTARGLDKIDDLFPGAIGNKNGLLSIGGNPVGMGSSFKGAVAHAQYNGIGLNPAYFGDADRFAKWSVSRAKPYDFFFPKKGSGLYRGQLPGYVESVDYQLFSVTGSPIGANTYEAVVMHEFAHVLDFMGGNLMRRYSRHFPSIPGYISDFKKTRRAKKLVYQVSEYAASDIDERWAEALASAIFTPEANLSPIARELRDQLPALQAHVRRMTEGTI